MNKLTKIGLTALAGSLIAGSVNAADMAVTGSASITFGGGDNNSNTGNGWSMTDGVTFSASGDVNDIGVTLSLELDGGAQESDTAGSSQLMDDRSITFDLGDRGTLVFAGHGGSSAMSARDDILPTAKEEPWDVVTGADADIINGHSGENMFTYTYDHDSGFKFVGAYLNASDAQSDTSYSDFGIEYSGIEGLRLVYAAGDVESVTNTKTEENTIAGTYAMGAITLGVQVSESDSNAANGDTESTGVGISYQVNEDLAVSYGAHTIEYATGSDQESTAVGFSYTMGSMSISGTMNSVDNIANAAANDREAYEFGVSFSF